MSTEATTQTTTATTTEASKKRPRDAIATQPSIEEILADEKLEICVMLVPKYQEAKKITKAFKKLGVEYEKIKKLSGKTFAKLTFKDKESKEKAVRILRTTGINGEPHPIYISRKMLSTAERVALEEAAEEPETKRPRVDSRDSRPDSRSSSSSSSSSSSEPPSTDARDTVTPLWKLSYPDQLKKKHQELADILKKIVATTKKESKYDIPPWVKKQFGLFCCPFEGMIPSPVIEGYRNKCGFTIGLDENGKTNVGFMTGRTRDSITFIADPSLCSTVSPMTLIVRNVVLDHIVSTGVPAYDKIYHTGYWRSVMVKTFSTGDVDVTMLINTVIKTPEENEELKKQFASALQVWSEEYRAKSSDPPLRNLSVYWQPWVGVSNQPAQDAPLELVLGNGQTFETINGMTFQVSPSAFFQTNTKGAEILYDKVGEWSGARSEADAPPGEQKFRFLLDICCGTGTIGLSLAKYVHLVVGVDIEPQAIEDAKKNAALNNISNFKYYASKAETVMGPMIATCGHQSVIGIVDPPRGGLHIDVIKAIRSCDNLHRLVYVSCNPGSLMSNAANLCRNVSKTMKGEPFRPIKCVGVDMFPGTNEMEVVMVFERGPLLQQSIPSDDLFVEKVKETMLPAQPK